MHPSLRSALFASLFLPGLPASHALELDYSGSFIFCSSTCDTFDALGGQSGGSANTTNSEVTGFIDLPLGADNAFAFSEDDNITFEFSFSNSAVDAQLPVVGPDDTCAPPNLPGQICNFATVNPMPMNGMVGRVSGSGQIGSNGLPQSGWLRFTWVGPPLASNGIELIVDLGTGIGEATLFGGVIRFFEFDGEFTSLDSDLDGIGDVVDNCIISPNADQRDTDDDGYGNRCDADLDNNCVVNVTDLGLLRSVFFTTDADADLNSDGSVNFIDLGILRTSFFRPPGPSAQTDACTANVF